MLHEFFDHTGLQKNIFGEPFGERLERRAFALVILLGVFTRTLRLSKSLWLDEAWVANSVLEPTWRHMFYYERWAQTTPPLVLVCMRSAVSLFGSGEIALRVVPFVAGAASVVLFGLALRKMFPPQVSLLATTFFATNYWAIKYSQQAKQYGTDLFVSTAFLFIVQDMLRTERARNFWLLSLAAAGGSFLSLPSLFWLPTAVLAIAWNDIRGNSKLTSILKRCLDAKCIALVTVFGISEAVSYLAFMRPNVTQGFSQVWTPYMLGTGRRAFQVAAANFAGLLIPPVHRLAYSLGLVLLTVICVGTLQVIRNAHRKDALSRLVLLTGVLPIATAIMLSLAKQVPLGDQQRVIIGLLPELVLILFYPFHLALQWFRPRQPSTTREAGLASVVSVLCVAIAALNWPIISSLSAKGDRYGFNEDNRGAVNLLAHNMGVEDCLFVSGGVSEQFDYYTRLFRWKPPCTHLSITDWQCCAKNWHSRVSNPEARSLAQDINKMLERERTGAVWVIGRSAALPRLPALMAERGYIVAESRPFGRVAIYAFRCIHCAVPH